MHMPQKCCLYCLQSIYERKALVRKELLWSYCFKFSLFLQKSLRSKITRNAKLLDLMFLPKRSILSSFKIHSVGIYHYYVVL